MTFFRLSVLAAMAAVLGGGASAKADTILVFGQNGTNSTIAASNNGAGSTTLFGSNIPVTITAIQAGISTPVTAFLTLNASSISPAITSGPSGNDVRQSFTGSFSITNGSTNYLSGSFTDAVFGSGSSLTMSASNTPPSSDTVNFTSNVITNLSPGRALAFSFSNVTPPVSIVNGSLGSFTASVAGNFSANIGVTPPTVVPEPATIAAAAIGIGCLGLGKLRRRKAVA